MAHVSRRRARSSAAGRTLEFVATFTGDPFQHSGYGQTLQTGGEPFALFSTSWTDAQGVFQSGGSLGVRTSNGSGETRTNLGAALLNAPHRFRIDWLPSQVVYSVDGVALATHPVTIGATMRPVAASDFNAFSGTILVDWVRSSPFVTTGSFVSRVFDASTKVDWQEMQWQANTPAGTTLAMSVRTGESPMPDATWSAFMPISSPGALGLHSQYIQYRADMSSADPNQTPSLADVAITGVVPVTPPTPPTPVSVSIGDVMLAEGNSGNTMFAFPVTLSAPTDHAVSVTFSTADGTATAESGDYQGVAGEVVIAPGAAGPGSSSRERRRLQRGRRDVHGVADRRLGRDNQAGDRIGADPERRRRAVADHRERILGRRELGQRQHDLYGHALGDQRQDRDRQLRDGERIGAGAVRLQGRVRRAELRARDRNKDDRGPDCRQHDRFREQDVHDQPVDARQCHARHRQATGTIIDDDTSTQTYTTVSDFAAGTLDAGTYIAETQDGKSSWRPASAQSSRERPCRPGGPRPPWPRREAWSWATDRSS